MSLLSSSSPSPTLSIHQIYLPISKVPKPSIAQPNVIHTTTVSTATTAEFEPSPSLWPLQTHSPLVPVTNDVDEGYLSDSDEHSIDSEVSEGSNLEPEWHHSLPYAPKSGYLFPCSDVELLFHEPLRYELTLGFVA
jgi:hypothetical protein